jgi:hypothetical protein
MALVAIDLSIIHCKLAVDASAVLIDLCITVNTFDIISCFFTIYAGIFYTLFAYIVYHS